MTQVHMLLQLKKINVDTFTVKMEDFATLIIMEKCVCKDNYYGTKCESALLFFKIILMTK